MLDAGVTNDIQDLHTKLLDVLSDDSSCASSPEELPLGGRFSDVRGEEQVVAMLDRIFIPGLRYEITGKAGPASADDMPTITAEWMPGPEERGVGGTNRGDISSDPSPPTATGPGSGAPTSRPRLLRRGTYGTRSQHILSVSRTGHVCVTERNRTTDGTWEKPISHDFHLGDTTTTT